uniref:Centrosomal protein of 68 kDa n=1 Tax=Castor canadensis TaxID=51338 RepID=A0A8C0WIQ6_CASCN|nr:centrosomal protein of 68 kDa [Castor canadensis]XP_020017273.1 centrosomal protein of 68 kDa [Castor canadensis]
MALGEEEAEVEASVSTKAQSCRRQSCQDRELPPQGPEPEQPPCLEAKRSTVSSEWEAEGLPAPACWPEADPGSASGAYLACAITAREPIVDGYKTAFCGPLPPASMGTRDLLPSAESQMEETKLSVSEELSQSVSVPRTTALCSGHDADTEDNPSSGDSPLGLGLSQQPHLSSFPFLSRWKPMVSPGAPPLSSKSISVSSMASSLQGHQEKVEPQNNSFAKVSSLELVIPQGLPSVMGPGPRLQGSSRPLVSGGDATGQGRRHLSFQAEYWACVLPDSLPPSPDRHSPLWNPNKEYEDLLDYTYPLRPGPHIPKQLDSHMLADPVLQDSGIDLDSFSVSPASTLKSPTNVSPNCSPAEVPALPFSESREPSLKPWPSRVPQKQDSMSLASWSQLTSTPRPPGNRDAPWKSREAALRNTRDWLPVGKHLDVDSSQLKTTRDGGRPSPRPEREKRVSQSVQHPSCMESKWKSEEEVESDDEYLALPTRLTQVSSLVSYLGAIPTLVTLPTRATKGQRSLEVWDNNGTASPASDSSQSQLLSGAAFQGSACPEGQSPCFLNSFVRAQNSTEEGSQVSSQALGVSSGLLKTRPSLSAVSDRWPFSDLDAGGYFPRKAGEQGKASLVQCVQTFCCQLEELIHWLYNVTDVTDLGTAPRSSLTGLKSSLQLYRQFKKDIDEHQSLTESVLEKGEILLQCLLDNTPVLKDVLGRIEKQSGELESHADRLYDSVLASLDMLAGCTLFPDKPVTAKERPCEGV